MSAAPSSPPRSTRRARLRALVLAPVRALGWLTLLAAGVALALTGSDLVRRELEAELALRLAPLGRSVSLDGVQVDWIGPGLRVDGLRVHEAGREHLFLERLHVGLRPSLTRGLELGHVHVDQGRVLISGPAIDDVRALLDSTGGAALEPGRLSLPDVQVRGLRVDFQDPSGASHHLGALDLSMRGEGRAPSRIGGRFVLPRARAAPRATEIHIAGLVSPDGVLALNTISDEIRVEGWELPRIEPFEALRTLSPRGRVTLFTSGSVRLRGALEPRGELNFLIQDGALRLPGVDEEVRDLEVAFASRFEPGPGQDFWTPRAWRGGARLAASWAGLPLRAGGRLGADAREGLAFESWIHAPRVDTDSPELRALEGPELLRTLFDAVDPHGFAEASVGITCEESLKPDEPLAPKLEFTARVENEGPVRGAYHGWPDPYRPDVRPLGFPMPAECDDVLVVFARTRRFPRRHRLDVRWRGRHATGPVDGLYQAWSNPVDMPPFARGYGKDEADLLLRVPRIELDAEVERHLPELWEIPELATLYDDYGLLGGAAAAVVHVSTRRALETPAVRVEVEVEGVSAAHHLLPVRAEEVAGRVTVVEGGRGASSVAFAVAGRTAGSRAVRVAGRTRAERRDPDVPVRASRLEVLEVDAREVELDGPDVAQLAALDEGLGEGLSGYGASGHADVEVRRTGLGDGPRRTRIEVSARPDTALRPEVLPVEARDVRGRVLVELLDDAPSSLAPAVRVAPLLGRWPGGVPVALHAEFGGTVGARGEVLGAGASLSDRDLLREVLAGLGEDPDGLLEGLAAVDLRGALDFAHRFAPREGAADGEVAQSVELRLRENALIQRAGIELEGLDGLLRLEDEALSGDEVRARLGATPVVLSGLRAERVGDGVLAEAEVRARGIPIRGPLLGQVLEEESAALLTEEFGLRGTLDLERGRLRIESRAGQEPTLRLSGEATLSDVYVAVGAPVSIRSARLELDRLDVQGDLVRGWGRVRDLYGQVVGRDLEQADLLVSYHGSQLTVETLDAGFCRGRLTGIRPAPGAAPGPAFAVELRPPYRFQVGLALDDVEVRPLLDGVFAGDIADRGYLDARFSLRGELDRLLEIEGSGFGRIEETVLWSVPVVRDLFSQLGLDETAVFDEMQSSFRVGEGAVRMEDMVVRSPLLKLRGGGLLRFDGTLRHDLEVRYSLVDRFGPFGSLVYWLQNRLLAISIRGDMSRPRVITRGVFSNPFGGDGDAWRALPYPDFSPLPARF